MLDWIGRIGKSRAGRLFAAALAVWIAAGTPAMALQAEEP